MAVRGSSALINPILDQLVLESQTLVLMYQSVIKDINEQAQLPAADRTAMIADACSKPHPSSGRTLPQQWDTMKMLCRSMERTLPGHSKGMIDSAESVTRTIYCLTHGVQVASTFDEACFPALILALLASVKAAITSYLSLRPLSDDDAPKSAKASDDSLQPLLAPINTSTENAAASSLLEPALSRVQTSIYSPSRTMPALVDDLKTPSASFAFQPHPPQIMKDADRGDHVAQPAATAPPPVDTRTSICTNASVPPSENSSASIMARSTSYISSDVPQFAASKSSRSDLKASRSSFDLQTTSEPTIPTSMPFARPIDSAKIPSPPAETPPQENSIHTSNTNIDDEKGSGEGASDLSRSKTLVLKKKTSHDPRASSRASCDSDPTKSTISPAEIPKHADSPELRGTFPVSKTREMFESKVAEPSAHLDKGRAYRGTRTAGINIDYITAKFEKMASTDQTEFVETQSNQPAQGTHQFPQMIPGELVSPDLKSTLASIDDILAAAGVPFPKYALSNNPSVSSGMGASRPSTALDPARIKGLERVLLAHASSKSLLQTPSAFLGVSGATFGDKPVLAKTTTTPKDLAGKRSLEKAQSTASLAKTLSSTSLNKPTSGSSTDVTESDPPLIMLMPLNDMFEICYLDLSDPVRMGRGSSGAGGKTVKVFDTRVVSRNHAELSSRDGKFYVRDIGSNGGTYLNGVRLCPPGQVSKEFDVNSGDLIQLGKDYAEMGPNATDVQHRCVKFQVAIIPIRNRQRQTSAVLSQAGVNEDSANADATKPQVIQSHLERTGRPSLSISTDNGINTTLSTDPVPLASSALASKEKQSVQSLKSGGDSASSKDSVLQVQARLAAYGLSGGRTRYVLAVTETSTRFAKVQVCTPHVYGKVVVEARVHEWHNKLRHMICTDRRPQFSSTSVLELVTNPILPQRCSITLHDSKMEVAQFEFVREQLKLQITTTLAGVTSPLFTLSGGLQESQFLVVMKSHGTREQKLLGEVLGRTAISKNAKEFRWATSFEMEESVFSQVLIMGIIYVALSKGQSQEK
ncbi:hypothetical protein SeLEV6574_g01910 [Synchytrium endobioticum]|uniref:FHA domain-containing protein n=1 Tax=Synchytrium endobioticum TaxID=286115 RepID=A0A507DAP4_9FUNG|nr:hypothetical protein SeLEV6574_g01910 [Synchytrium endobioticum]